jgi:DNA-binding response OmpR family regulator
MESQPVILLVDDEPDMLDNLSLALQIADYPHAIARDGMEALEILQTQPIQLILSDIIMPRMDGYHLYQQVRENPLWAAIQFIFLTGCWLDSEVRYGKELGVDDYLVKPVKTEHLIAVIQGKLRRARQLASVAVQ